jgi:hypothetical protein
VAKAKGGITKLLDAQPVVTRGRSFKQSLSPKLYRSIEADLKAVLKAESEGRPTPTTSKLCDYIYEEYDLCISFGGVYEWMRRLRKEVKNGKN